YPAGCFPGWSPAPAAHAELHLAVVAASDPGPPDLSVPERRASGLTAERSRFPFVAVVRGGWLARSAGPTVAGWRAAYPAAGDFSPVALSAVPARRAQALFAMSAPDSAAALPRHAAGTGN